MAYLVPIEDYNFDNYYDEIYIDDKIKIIKLWEQLKILLNDKTVINSGDTFHGEIGIFDERGKCKDMNLKIYDTNFNEYIFDWRGPADRIWEIDDGFGYFEINPDPVPLFLEYILKNEPNYIKIYKADS